jgi:glycosyltransferase involved in cell wall biosynthesis
VGTSNRPIRLSVVVPVYNGARFLERCLESLAHSEFRNYECIVVDDGSTEDIAPVVAQHGVTLVVLEDRNGPARARNRGAEHARGEILVFLDADVCVHPDTLSRVDAHFRDHPATDAVMGSYDDRPADAGFVSQYKNLFHHYVHQNSRAEAWTFWAGCGAIRRRAFEAMHGFDESYRRPCIEDIELGLRLRAAGHRIDLNRMIQATHLKRWTFWSLMRTDLRDRGIPWLLLMLRARTMPPDLNVTLVHRLSVALVFAMVLLSAACTRQLVASTSFAGTATPKVILAVLLALGSVLFVANSDLYGFFARKRGIWFAARAVPLHWLYYGYCGLAVGVALSIYLWSKLPLPRHLCRAEARG